MRIKLTVTVAVLAGVAGCASPVPPGVPAQLTAATRVMTTTQIKAELVGKTWIGTQLAQGYAWTTVSRPDGSLQYDGNGGHAIGHTVIRDNASCETWPEFGPGVVKCFKILKYGDNAYATYHPDGSISSLFHLAP